MKFRVIKASDWEYTDHKSFYSIEEIYEYLKKVDESGRMGAVLYFTGNKEDDQELWIYDSYISLEIKKMIKNSGFMIAI